MLVPQVLAPRGVYESCFYVFTVGTLVLFSVTSQGLLHRRRVVRSADEYTRTMLDLTVGLDAHDPPPALTLVE